MHVTDKPARTRRAVASSETAREINRDILLHAIHLHQPVSRADLARLTGLQPSTVSVIIGQLIDEEWVVPGSLGRLPRGRRPTYVTLNDRHVTLAIDLRPGKANLAVVDINGKILGREAVDFEIKAGSTPDEARMAIAHIARAARSLRATYSDRMFQGLGVSVSGRVDQRTHRLLFSPNAPWGQIDLYAELQRVLDTPIEMENAANACIVAERWFGNFGDVSNMIAVSVSEGIGAGIDAPKQRRPGVPIETRPQILKRPVRYAGAAAWGVGRHLHRTAPGCGTTANWRRKAHSIHFRSCSSWHCRATFARCAPSTK